eukprot:gene10615-12395_t
MFMSVFVLLVVAVLLVLSATGNTFSDQKEGDSLGAKKSEPPIIDVSPLVNSQFYSETEQILVRQQILDAAHSWGFFQVINHGISVELQQNLTDQMKLFFDSPQNIKNSIKRTESNSRGFADDELTKRLKDVKEILDIGQVPYTDLSLEALRNQELDGVNQWPSGEHVHLQQLKPTCDAYYQACLELSQILVRALSQVIPCGNATYFEKAFDRHSSFLRLNYYPVLVDGVDAGAVVETKTRAEVDSSLPRRLGVSRHTDAGALTVLFQDPNPMVLGGLEVYSGTKEDNGDGEWVPVIPVPGALTINTGDMMQVWSNGLLKAPEHRVRPTMEAHRARYSAPFFYNPNYDTIVTPLTHQCGKAPGVDESEVVDIAILPNGGSESTFATSHQSADSTIDYAKYTNELHYAPIRWGDYRNSRFQGDFKDVGEEIQIEHFQASA